MMPDWDDDDDGAHKESVQQHLLNLRGQTGRTNQLLSQLLMPLWIIAICVAMVTGSLYRDGILKLF